MQNLLEYLYNEQYSNIVLENYCEIVAEEMINEAFQSSLLLALAKKINDVESEKRETDKKRAEYYKEQGYLSTPSKDAKSFASIFGPVVGKNKKGEKTGVVAQGLKWSEIKDSDFKKFTSIEDKEFKKIIKSVYNHTAEADFICCKPGTKDIVYFIKGYGRTIKDDARIYQFTPVEQWQGKGVHEIVGHKYKYNERALNLKETLPIIDGTDIYVLVITDSMKTEYNLMATNRFQSQKGVINYDKESLSNLLKEQQARYKTLLEKMKALKLQSNSEAFLDEIIAINNEVSELFKKVTGNPVNMDMNLQMGELIQYVGYTYDQYYKSLQYTRQADKEDEKYPGYSFSKYNRDEAEKSMNYSKKYLDEIKAKIKEIKAKIK